MFESRPPIYSCKFKPDSAKVFSSWWQISIRATNSSEKFLNGCPSPSFHRRLKSISVAGGNDDTIRSRIIKHFPGVSQTNYLSRALSKNSIGGRKRELPKSSIECLRDFASFNLFYPLSIVVIYILNRPQILNIDISLFLNEFIKRTLPILFRILISKFKNRRLKI